MQTVAVGRLLIAKSADGESDWQLVKPQDVPAWLQNPSVLGEMLEGKLAHDTEEPESPWYCAVRVSEQTDGLAETEASAILPAPTPCVVVPRLVTSGGIPVSDP